MRQDLGNADPSTSAVLSQGALGEFSDVLEELSNAFDPNAVDSNLAVMSPEAAVALIERSGQEATEAEITALEEAARQDPEILGTLLSPEESDRLTEELVEGYEEEGRLVNVTPSGVIIATDAMTDAGGTTPAPRAPGDDFADISSGDPFDVGLGNWLAGAGPSRNLHIGAIIKN